ncbi:EAL domain-containing response regulator [Pseudomonas fluorescens]|uniref:EAL domain-containing response regulator n=1 Tax=Pseudomonas fluorescens TaxID=294 RepID=UPI0028562C5F|nr:EAL domain-containing response regulator [Pseudomonas fluorescens]MDR6165556.1 EAL domain-containing protein (putative c-di-GMP-specific phosphodiesterase class I) [Pseudomonas fluorescens]
MNHRYLTRIAPMLTSPLRLIVLEDHAFQRAIAVNMLRQSGYVEVFSAADGNEALAVLEKVGPVDIALCDLRMEGMDGLEFIQQAGACGLVKSIIVCSSVSPDLRRAVGQVAALSGLELLGDVGKPLKYEPLELLLKKYVAKPAVKVQPQRVIDLPSEYEVRRAIAAKEFTPYFQPKFNLRTGNVKAVEVLARWQNPTLGLLPPSLFLQTVERCGLMDQLLFGLMEKSLHVQQQLKKRSHGLNFAFNMHSSQLSSMHLLPRIRGLLAEHNMPGSDLTFELTESGLLEISAASLDTLVRLRMMGCNLSIDDFGAGFSSLQRMCQLPFNELKIDAEFVRMLGHEPRCEGVIISTLALGKELGLSVVVEGIETEHQRRQLLEWGCVEGQGYLKARPMNGSSLAKWMDSLRLIQSDSFGESR